MIFAVILAAGIAAFGYYQTALYYRTHFFPNTVINGVDCSRMEAAAVAEMLDARLGGFTGIPGLHHAVQHVLVKQYIPFHGVGILLSQPGLNPLSDIMGKKQKEHFSQEGTSEKTGSEALNLPKEVFFNHFSKNNDISFTPIAI